MERLRVFMLVRATEGGLKGAGAQERRRECAARGCGAKVGTLREMMHSLHTRLSPTT